MKTGLKKQELTGEAQGVERRVSNLRYRENKLTRREMYFKALLEAFDGLIYISSLGNRIEFVNDRVIEYVGRDITGEVCHKAVYGMDDVCPWCIEQAAFNGETVRNEFKSPHNGRWYYNFATPVHNPDGTISKLTVCLDITDKKEAEEAVVESKRRLQTLMNNLPGMAYRCKADETYSMEFASQGSVKLFGYEPHELLGTAENPTAFQNVVHVEDRKNMLQLVELAVSEKRAFSFIYRVCTSSGGEKWVWEQGEGVFSEDGELVALEGFITDVTEQKEVELDLREENIRLKSSIKDRYRFGNIIGKSHAMQEVYELILKAAATDVNVIISGESGTGKELVAQAIHSLSSRREGSFVPINCGAIPENLLEREFFGHRKGAFTGADKDIRGYLDIADGGTLFLDELGEIGPGMQVKLLRAIEGKGHTPVGGSEVKHSDFRIVAATNRNLAKLVKQGKMREDFFYRIHILPITLPPLRERKDDVHLLIDHFLEHYAEDEQKHHIPIEVREALETYNWPGNVRELQNMLHSYITLGKLDFMGKLSTTSELPDKSRMENQLQQTGNLRDAVEAFERQLILQALEKTRWHRSQAAAMLGLNRRTLHRKMEALNIK